MSPMVKDNSNFIPCFCWPFCCASTTTIFSPKTNGQIVPDFQSHEEFGSVNAVSLPESSDTDTTPLEVSVIVVVNLSPKIKSRAMARTA